VLVFMMLFQTASVVLRQLFATPVLGVVDIMELSLVALIFIAMPGVFLRDENVTVDVIDHAVPRGMRVALRLAGLVLTLGFLTMMFVNMIPQAMDKWHFREVTMTLGINRFVHWTPIIFGFALSILATACVLGLYLRRGVPTDALVDRDGAA
jgi:TRAP-type C4-dicarboxylate transport system permease small subunit